MMAICLGDRSTHPENMGYPAPINYFQEENPMPVVGAQFIHPQPMRLIISKSGDILTFTDIKGESRETVFTFSTRDPRVLMDASGNPLVFLQKKILTAHRRWDVFKGESSSNELSFSVKKSSLFAKKLEVFLASNTDEDACNFSVKGNWKEDDCNIYAGDSDTIIAEIKKADKFVYFKPGDKFCPVAVNVYPDVDYAFISALAVVVLGGS